MALESQANLLQGGAGLTDRVPAILKELAGLKFTVAAGVAQPVRASQTIALSGVTAGQLVTIAGTRSNGLAFSETFVAGTDFSVAGDDTADGEALEAEINERLAGLVTANNAAGTVTVTAVPYGQDPNAWTLVKTGAGITLGGANFASGAGNVAIAGMTYPDTVLSVIQLEPDNGTAATMATDRTSVTEHTVDDIQVVGVNTTGKQLLVVWYDKA